MEQYTILASAEEVFEDVNGCFVVMVLRCHTLGGKEGKDRRDFWSCAAGERVDTAGDTFLVDLVRRLISGSL